MFLNHSHRLGSPGNKPWDEVQWSGWLLRSFGIVDMKGEARLDRGIKFSNTDLTVSAKCMGYSGVKMALQIGSPLSPNNPTFD